MPSSSSNRYAGANPSGALQLLTSRAQGPSLSLDSASVSVPNASRTSCDRVDLPMRAFAGGFYNNLKHMYDYLGVRYHSQPFLFEFARADVEPAQQQDGYKDSSYFVHASNFHQPEPRPKAVATVSYVVEVVYLLACYAWFTVCCFLIPPRNGSDPETLEAYLRRVMVPQYFMTYYILPLISSVTTCPHQALLAFPASDVIEYKRRTHGAPHYTVSNGVHAVQEKLAGGIECEFSVTVSTVDPGEKGIRVSWKKSGAREEAGRAEYFDRVVLAVAPNIVGQIFEPLRAHMMKVPTTLVESVVHLDRRILNAEDHLAKDSHGAQLIYLRTSTRAAHQTESLHVQPCGAIVTTCPFSPIDPALTIHSAKFTRVLRSPASRRIVNSIFGDTPRVCTDEKAFPWWKNGDDNVWLVGGWCWDGMVLLEGCIVSAMRVARAFDVEVPWEK